MHNIFHLVNLVGWDADLVDGQFGEAAGTLG